MKKNILGVKVNNITPDLLEQELVKYGRNNSSGYVCFCNVHMLIEAYEDNDFRQVVNDSSFTVSDGVPISKAMYLFHKIKQPRIAGMDFFPLFLKSCQRNNLKVSFLGSTTKSLNFLKNKLKKDFPNLRTGCFISPPFDQDWDNITYIKEINNTETNVLFVALGCPKQEKWMKQHKNQVKAIMLGIGGALPTYTEEVSRAPRWMQVYSLEWFYRLLLDPKRMFKRYFITNTKFICFVSWFILCKFLKKIF